MNRRLGELLRQGLTTAGFEVTRVGRGANCTPTYSRIETVIRRYLENVGDHIAVDIAAADGKSGSNTYALWKAGWQGLAVEGAPGVFARLGLNYRHLPQVALHRGWVTPANAVDLLRAAGIPKQFGFLSLDIDGYDHDVLDALLSGFRPSLVCVEINERYPPPILFNLPYSPRYVYNGDGCSGQSLSMLDLLRAQHDYALVGLEYQDAFLVPLESGVPTVPPEELYQIGYANRPDRQRPWLEEFEPLQTMESDDGVQWVHRRFRDHEGEFICSHARHPSTSTVT
jgi:hypothetical protein